MGGTSKMKRELFVASRTLDQGTYCPFTITYLILIETLAWDLEQYGVKIVENNSRKFAAVSGITISAERISMLVDLLIRGTVTPTGLLDVLADWL